MWKIVTVLVLTALAIFAARLAHDVPLADFEHAGSIVLEATSSAPATPPLMYAGIRG